MRGKKSMIKAIVSDLSRTLLFPKDENCSEGLNPLHKRLSSEDNYDFWAYFKLNQDLLNLYQTINDKVTLYMLTTGHIQEWPPLKEKLQGIFKGIFSTAVLDWPSKSDPQTFKILAQKIGIKPNEILYIDDNKTFIEAAKQSGLIVVTFESNEQAIQDINNKLANNL